MYNVNTINGAMQKSVEERMCELERLLKTVRSAVIDFGQPGWFKYALGLFSCSMSLSALDAEITEQLDSLLTFYGLARDAHIIEKLEFAIEAEVKRQILARRDRGEVVDKAALEDDPEVVRGVAVASGISDAEFRKELLELREEVRKAYEKHSPKLDDLIDLNQIQLFKVDELADLIRGLKVSPTISVSEPTNSSRLSFYEYERRPDAPRDLKAQAAARLGGGAFGSTFCMRKKDGIDERLYAVKFIEDRSSELPQSELAKEARLLSRLDHDNTVRYVDAFWHSNGEGTNQFVIVMELLAGGSLQEKIDTGRSQPTSAVAKWGQQIASALAYLHSLNLQHRDLKPANVMLDSTGRAKIIDFGLACVSSASRSRAMTMVGTDAYMSPEKDAGKGYGPDDDVWAAGCIIGELLLGRRIGKVARDETKRKRAIAESKSASGQLGSWVEGCLQETPRQRPAAAQLEQGLTSDSSWRGEHEAEVQERLLREAEEQLERARREAVHRSKEEAREERAQREREREKQLEQERAKRERAKREREIELEVERRREHERLERLRHECERLQRLECDMPLTADQGTTKSDFFAFLNAAGLPESTIKNCQFNSNSGKEEAIRLIRAAMAKRLREFDS